MLKSGSESEQPSAWGCGVRVGMLVFSLDQLRLGRALELHKCWNQGRISSDKEDRRFPLRVSNAVLVRFEELRDKKWLWLLV